MSKIQVDFLFVKKTINELGKRAAKKVIAEKYNLNPALIKELYANPAVSALEKVTVRLELINLPDETMTEPQTVAPKEETSNDKIFKKPKAVVEKTVIVPAETAAETEADNNDGDDDGDWSF